MQKIDVRIFGVPERMPQIQKNKELLGLPDEHIIMDYEHIGCMPTARRAWSFKDDETAKVSHIMVLSDDVELCDDFMSYCHRVIAAHPQEIISLFPLTLANRNMVGTLPTRSPYVVVQQCSGAGIMMPREYVDPCISYWRDDIRGDDTNITRWARDNGVQILTTLPALIQHLDGVSMFDPSRNLGGTEFFNPNPSWARWDDPYVNSWTNIIRRD